MPTITYIHKDEKVKVDVPEGDTVRYPALEHDVPLYPGLWKVANCHGNGMCGTDRVIVSPASHVNPLTALEKLLLRGDLKKYPNLRLACQVHVYGDVEVKTLA